MSQGRIEFGLLWGAPKEVSRPSRCKRDVITTRPLAHIFLLRFFLIDTQTVGFEPTDPIGHRISNPALYQAKRRLLLVILIILYYFEYHFLYIWLLGISFIVIPTYEVCFLLFIFHFWNYNYHDTITEVF